MGFWTNIKKVSKQPEAAAEKGEGAAEGQKYKKRAQQLKEDVQKLQARIRELIDENQALRSEASLATDAAATAVRMRGDGDPHHTSRLDTLGAASPPAPAAAKPLGDRPNPREVKEGLTARVQQLLAEKRWYLGQIEGFDGIYRELMGGGRPGARPVGGSASKPVAPAGGRGGAASGSPGAAPAGVDDILADMFGASPGGGPSGDGERLGRRASSLTLQNTPQPARVLAVTPPEDDLMEVLFSGTPSDPMSSPPRPLALSQPPSSVGVEDELMGILFGDGGSSNTGTAAARTNTSSGAPRTNPRQLPISRHQSLSRPTRKYSTHRDPAAKQDFSDLLADI